MRDLNEPGAYLKALSLVAPADFVSTLAPLREGGKNSRKARAFNLCLGVLALKKEEILKNQLTIDRVPHLSSRFLLQKAREITRTHFTGRNAFWFDPVGDLKATGDAICHLGVENVYINDEKMVDVADAVRIAKLFLSAVAGKAVGVDSEQLMLAFEENQKKYPEKPISTRKLSINTGRGPIKVTYNVFDTCNNLGTVHNPMTITLGSLVFRLNKEIHNFKWEITETNTTTKFIVTSDVYDARKRYYEVVLRASYKAKLESTVVTNGKRGPELTQEAIDKPNLSLRACHFRYPCLKRTKNGPFFCKGTICNPQLAEENGPTWLLRAQRYAEHVNNFCAKWVSIYGLDLLGFGEMVKKMGFRAGRGNNFAIPPDHGYW